MAYIEKRDLARYLLPFIVIGFLLIFTQSTYAQTTITSPVSGSTQTATQYALFELPITVTGGLTPYGFTVTGLPSGFEVVVNDARDGATIEGVTSSSTSSVVQVQVSDSDEGNITSDSITFNLDITPISTTTTIIIDSPDVYRLPEGTINETYNTVTFSTTDDSIEDSQYSYSVSSGSIPAGMGLSSGDGTLIGTPTESGEFNFTVTVTDIDTSTSPNKSDGNRDYKLVINGGSSSGDLQISSPTSSNLPNGILGRSYATDIDATGGDGQYFFTQSGLPGGLTIDSSTGLITGSPTATGTFNVTITVTDNNGSGDSASRNYTVTITETGEAGYSSLPTVGSTLDFGNVNIGATFSINLIVSETGSDQLDVLQPAGGLIQGIDAANFSITSNSPPFSIANGGNPVAVRITCSPDEAGDYDAFLRFETNDADNPIVLYSLFCTGVLDGGNEDPVDSGDGTTGDGTADIVNTPTPSIPTQTPLPPTYSNVIEVKGLSLRTAPFIGASRRAVLRPDINYRVTAKNNQEGVYMWYYIVTDDGIEGWASGRYLAVYGDDVPFSGSVIDNVWNERDRGVVVEAIDNIHMRPGPSDRTQPYPDLVPWAGRMRVFARTTSGRGDEWYAVEYNGIRGWVYAPVTKVVEGLMEAIPKY